MTKFFSGLRAMTLGASLVALSSATMAAAQDYPSKLVTILVGYGAGGASDVTARLLASHMYSDKGAKVIVENKPGAGGRLAA